MRVGLGGRECLWILRMWFVAEGKSGEPYRGMFAGTEIMIGGRTCVSLLWGSEYSKIYNFRGEFPFLGEYESSLPIEF